MAISLSTGWSASRLVPKTGLPGTPLSLQQNPMYAQLAKALGLPPAQPAQPTIAGPTDVPGYVPTPIPVPGVNPRSAPGAFSQSGNIILPNSVTRAAPTPLQSGLAKAIGIPNVVAATPVAGIPGLSGGTLPTGGLPGQSAYVSPLTNIAPMSLAPAPIANAGIPGVTNFNTLANQNQNLPPWLLNAVQNLNNPNNFNPVAPAPVPVGGYDPLIGSTMAATEARIAAQQKDLAESNKLRIQQAKAEAAAAEHAHELQVQRQRGMGTFSFPQPSTGYQSGWI